MVIQGMELFAVAVLILLFVMVLKQFGIKEPLLLDGKNRRMVLLLALVYCKKGKCIVTYFYIPYNKGLINDQNTVIVWDNLTILNT